MKTTTVRCDECGRPKLLMDCEWIEDGPKDFCSKKCEKRHRKRAK
jgi:endogenous inhibitor of DNA gyrase (YacG/DUF329 family)